MSASAFRTGGRSLRGALSGFVPSVAGGDPDHDITISAGGARSSDGTASLERASPITKKIDVDFAEGDNQGGFPSALSLAANTWYHKFIIGRTSDAVVDAGFDSNLSAINLLNDATGFSTFRNVGSVLTDSSANIIGFVSIETNGGGLFIQWNAPPLDVDVGNIGTAAAVLRPVSTPLGKKTLAQINAYNFATVDDGVHFLSSPNIPDLAPSITTSPLGSLSGNVAGGGASEARMLPMQVLTDASSQIRSRDTNSTAGIRIVTMGYTEFRTV